MVRFGNTELPKEPLFLAPMEDVSDTPFRALCKDYGADFMFTEFASSDALIRNVNKSIDKIKLNEAERPIGIQLYGSKIDAMVEAAIIAQEQKPDLIDLNFGCPVRKIATKGGGSGMLRDVPKLIEMTKAVIDAVDLPVTVKTRLGWDHDNLVIYELAEALQDIGIKGLTIHGRTREQMYTGEADWTLIGQIKNNPRMHIPIIGNGDIDSGEKARLYLDRYGVDGLMIGRASIGNPSIFRDIKHFLKTGEHAPNPSVSEQVKLLKILIDNSIAFKGLPGGILHMRRHMALNFKGLPDFRSLRIRMLRADNKTDLWEIFDLIDKKYGDTSFSEQ